MTSRFCCDTIKDLEKLERIPIMLQYILHERRIWRHFGGKPSHELTDAATKRIPETRIARQHSAFSHPLEIPI